MDVWHLPSRRAPLLQRQCESNIKVQPRYLVASTTLRSFLCQYSTMTSNRPPAVQCRHLVKSGGQCARMTTNRPPVCVVHGGAEEPPPAVRLLDDVLLGRSAVIEAGAPDHDRLLDDSALWEMAKLAHVRVDDRSAGQCRCREWHHGDTVATGPTGPLHPDGTIAGGCAVHDERHATPGGTFLAVANDAGYEESPMIAEAAQRFAADIEDGADVWDSWHPENHALRQ